MSLLGLLSGAAIVAAVVATWLIDRRVLRSGNVWLTWASCALIAWAGVLVVHRASMSVTSGPDHTAVDWVCAVFAGQCCFAFPLLIATVASTFIEWGASSHPKRWRILVVPFVACSTIVSATALDEWIWNGIP